MTINSAESGLEELRQQSNKKLFSSRTNNFDLMRLGLALSVCLVHMYELSDLESLKFLTFLISSSIAVKCFFVISGYLIFMSFERNKSIKKYFENRLRRIFPAYFVVIMLSAILLPLYFSSLKFENAATILNYIFFNLLYFNFLSPDLPSVFAENKITAVNGALWTLKVEVMFYLCVPLIVILFSKFRRIYVLLFFYGLSLIYYYVLELSELAVSAELQRQLPGQLTYFLAGGYCYYNFDRLMQWILPLALLAILSLMISPAVLLPIIEPVALSIIVLFFCYFKYFGNFSRYGDFSYGVYIVHFPIIQLMVSAGVPARGGLFFAMATLICVGVLSALLWHCIEKRFLKRSVSVRSGQSPT